MSKEITVRSAELPAPKVFRGRAGVVQRILKDVGVFSALAAGYAVTEEWLTELYDSAFASGVDLDADGLSKKEKEQVVVVELAKKAPNLQKFDFARSRKLGEAYERMRDAYRSDQRVVDPVPNADHDAEQLAVTTEAGDDDLVRQQYIKDVASVCSRLGLTGASRYRELYEIAQIINSIRQVNVDDAETHERIFGPVRV